MSNILPLVGIVVFSLFIGIILGSLGKENSREIRELTQEIRNLTKIIDQKRLLLEFPNWLTNSWEDYFPRKDR